MIDSMEKKESLLKELLKFSGQKKAMMHLSLIFSALSTILGILPYICLFFIIKEVIEVAPNFQLAIQSPTYAILAVVFALASMILYFLSLMFSHSCAFSIASNIRKTLLEHVAKLPLGFVDQIGSGKLRRIIHDASEASETYLAHQLPDSISVYTTPIVMVILLFVFDWKFGLISLIPVVISFACMGKMMGSKMVEDMKHYQNALDSMNNEAVEYIRGMSVIKTFSQTVYSFSRFKNSIDTYYKFCIHYTKECRMPMILFEVAINSTFAFLIVMVLALCHFNVSVSDILINFIFYIIFTPLLSTAFLKIMFMQESKMAVVESLERIHSVLDISPLHDSNETIDIKNTDIEFDHVTFRYKDQVDPAIDDLSLNIKSGQVVAFVGPSGSGKSTLAGLISRFWDVENGVISIGAHDISKYPIHQLNELISYVFQDNHLMKGTIEDNVRLSKQNATTQEVLEALHNAQCDDILDKFSTREKTVIGSKGVYLSLGEQQRIAIARVFLKNSPIVILDEASAFADPENEVLVQKAFHQLCKDKTVIMIAHRLTTVTSADCIYVMNEGKIVESGTHDDLMKQHGLYQTMFDDYQTSIQWKVGEAYVE